MSTIITTTHTKKAAMPAVINEPLFSVDYHVYINHTDAGGIVYHANHLVFFENCRRDWFTTLGLNTYFLQTNDGQIQHFVVSQAELQYRKAILLDEVISVRIDKVELKPASIIFYQSIHRHLPNHDSDNKQNTVQNKSSDAVLSSGKIVIACVQNQAKSNDAGHSTKESSTNIPIRPIRVPQQLQDSIQRAIAKQAEIP